MKYFAQWGVGLPSERGGRRAAPANRCLTACELALRAPAYRRAVSSASLLCRFNTSGPTKASQGEGIKKGRRRRGRRKGIEGAKDARKGRRKETAWDVDIRSKMENKKTERSKEGGEESWESPPPPASNQIPSPGINEPNEPLRPASNGERRETH